MRALKVLGIAENGAQIVCQPVPDDEDRTAKAPVAPVETFTLAVDERLRAAVRGDLSRIGQLEIEMESQLRPREIQQRIRAGSTVEQVAAAAGCSPDRIERYAYPVLLERSTIADKARRAHPVVDGVVGARSVEAVAGDTLAARGQQAAITWDAFRDERGWALRASWKAGRSENRATWSYHAGPAGGTVVARDEGAAMLVDPAPRPLRTVAAETPAQGTAATRPQAPAQSPAATRTPAATPGPTPARTTPGPTPAPTAAPAPSPAPADLISDEVVADTAPTEADDVLDEQRRLVADTVIDARSGSRPPSRADAARDAATSVLPAAEVRDTGTDGPPAARSKRGHRPQMPSWEDVLLGTRTGR